jgi:hypothetical protein
LALFDRRSAAVPTSISTGRCADSALSAAPLIHAFGWRAADLDQLAMGSLAGHIIECGPQATGGT